MGKKRNTKFFLVGMQLDFMHCRRITEFFSSKEEAEKFACDMSLFAYKLYKAECLTRKGKTFHAKPELVANIMFGELLSRKQVEELVASCPESKHFQYFLSEPPDLENAVLVCGCRLFELEEGCKVVSPFKG